MLVLDENLPESQRQLLRKWRMPFRSIGTDLAPPGTGDEQIIPLLHHLPRSTFFSLDRNFHRPDWADPRYCLVWLDVPDDRAAAFIRRFLRHPAFNTQAKRMGRVVRAHADGLSCWAAHGRVAQLSPWPSA